MLGTPGLAGDGLVEVSETIDPGIIYGITVTIPGSPNIYDHSLFVEVGISDTPFSNANIRQLLISDFVSQHHPASFSGTYHVLKSCTIFLRASGNNNPSIHVFVSKLSFTSPIIAQAPYVK